MNNQLIGTVILKRRFRQKMSLGGDFEREKNLKIFLIRFFFNEENLTM